MNASHHPKLQNNQNAFADHFSHKVFCSKDMGTFLLLCGGPGLQKNVKYAHQLRGSDCEVMFMVCREAARATKDESIGA